MYNPSERKADSSIQNIEAKRVMHEKQVQNRTNTRAHRSEYIIDNAI